MLLSLKLFHETKTYVLQLLNNSFLDSVSVPVFCVLLYFFFLYIVLSCFFFFFKEVIIYINGIESFNSL